MNLQTRPSYNQGTKRTKFSFQTLILGIVFISISIILTLLVAIPELTQAVLAAKGEILKGVIVGITILPVLLFVTIKGGKFWYKKLWSWLSIGITCVALIAITLASVSRNELSDLMSNTTSDTEMSTDYSPVDESTVIDY